MFAHHAVEDIKLKLSSVAGRYCTFKRLPVFIKTVPRCIKNNYPFVEELVGQQGAERN